MKKLYFLIICLILSLTFVFCGKSKDSGNEKDNKEKSEKVAEDSENYKLETDSEVEKLVQNMIKECKLHTDSNYITDCEKKHKTKDGRDATAEELIENIIREKGPHKLIDTVIAAFESGDEKRILVANSSILNRAAFQNFSKISKEKGAISSKQAKRFLKSIKNLKNTPSNGAAAIAHIAILGGIKDELYKYLDNEPTKNFTRYVIPNIMTYARLETFPKVKEIAENDKLDQYIRAAAISAPRNMYDATEQERKEIGDWALKFLETDTLPILEYTGYLLVYCKGVYIDKLLESYEKRLKEKPATVTRNTYYMVLRDICMDYGLKAFGVKEPGKADQCKRNFKLLQDVADNEKVDNLARGLCLYAIYYQKRDEETLKIMKKYSNHKVEDVKKYANEAIKSIEESLKNK